MAPPHSNSNSTTTTRRRNLSDTQPQPQPSTALTTTTANTTSSLLSPTKPKPTTTTKMATPRPHRPHHHQTPRSTTKTNARTPIRRVRGNGTLTSAQKRIIVDNIGLEMNDRIRRLRAQYDVTAQALKHRIEMRINRVPKKLWSAKMGELLFQHVGQQSSKALLIARNAAQSKKMGKGFVEEVREVKRFSNGGSSSINSDAVVVAKVSKNSSKGTKNTGSNASSDVPNLRPSSASVPNMHLLLLSSPLKSSNNNNNNGFSRTPLSPVKRALSPQHSQQQQQQTNDDRPRRRSPLRSSQLSIDSNSTAADKAASRAAAADGKSTSTSTTLKVSRSNAVKSRNFKAAPIVLQQQAAENNQHFVKSIGSSGSLKENKVEGINKKDRVVSGGKGSTRSATTNGSGGGQTGSGGRRVLRARK